MPCDNINSEGFFRAYYKRVFTVFSGMPFLIDDLGRCILISGQFATLAKKGTGAVPANRQEPCPDLGASLVTCSIAPNPHEHFIGQLLRQSLVADEPHEAAVEPDLVAADQGTQG